MIGSTTWCRAISTAAHLSLPGASDIIRLYDHQKAGDMAQSSPRARPTSRTAVGSGKTYSMAAAVMEERRLGVVKKCEIAANSDPLRGVFSRPKLTPLTLCQFLPARWRLGRDFGDDWRGSDR